MESIREKLRKVVTEPWALKDYGNTAIIVEVLQDVLDELEEVKKDEG